MERGGRLTRFIGVPSQAFHKAGFPPGVVNLVTGKGSEIGDFLTTHPAVNCIRWAPRIQSLAAHPQGLQMRDSGSISS